MDFWGKGNYFSRTNGELWGNERGIVGNVMWNIRGVSPGSLPSAFLLLLHLLLLLPLWILLILLLLLLAVKQTFVEIYIVGKGIANNM